MARADSSGGGGTRTEEPNQTFWTCLDFFGGVWTFWTFVEEVRLTEPNYTCSEEKRKAPKISNAI